MTPDEREWISWNFEQDQGQEDNASEITAWQGFMMACRDPKTWLLMGLLYCVYICGAVVSGFVTDSPCRLLMSV